MCLWLKYQELGVLGIASLHACLCVLRLCELAECEITTVEHLSLFATLLLLDVVGVGVPKESETTEGQQEIALTGVV